MKLIAINEIEYLNSKGQRALATPGSLFDVDDETGARLIKMGAAREPNEAEQALETLRGQKAKTARKSSGASNRSTKAPRGPKSAPKKDDSEGDSEDEGNDGGNARDDDVV